MLLKQVIISLIIGYSLAKITKYLIDKVKNIDISFSMAFLVAMVLLSFSLSEYLGSNGYISVYLYGILIGNLKFKKKNEIVSFFNGITSIMQMLIFFLLGLLASPTKAIMYLPYSLAIMLALTCIIRPIVCFTLLKPFKAKLNQIALISFSGLRGVASVVFSLYCISINETLGYIVFNISFIIVLLSISIQGFILPYVAKKLDMIDEKEDVLKTFNDYSEEENVDFITFEITKDHKWIGKKICEINLMPSVLLVLIIRNDKNIIPNGQTKIFENDKIVLCGNSLDTKMKISLLEIFVEKNSKYINKYIYEITDEILIVLIKRLDKTLIPTGNTKILGNDKLVFLQKNTI